MKLKFIYINLLIVFLTGASLLAQNLPQNFRFGKNAAVNAASDDNPASNSVSDIVLAGDTVWIGTSRGLSLSTDRGETWTNFYGTKAFGTESVSALGYNNGVLWASTAHSEDKDGSSLPVGSGLRYTTDGGSTWNTVPQPLDDPGDSSLVYGVNDGVRAPKIRALPVTVAVQNIIYDIAFTPGTVWIATFAGGLRKSTDMGKTWQRVLLPADYLNEINPSDTLHYTLQPVAGKFGSENYLNHRVFSVVAANDSTLYVGTAGGINKSTDNGISWKKFSHNNQDDPISGNFVVAMGYNNANNTIWGATW